PRVVGAVRRAGVKRRTRLLLLSATAGGRAGERRRGHDREAARADLPARLVHRATGHRPERQRTGGVLPQLLPGCGSKSLLNPQMQLPIDNFDGFGPRDYTSALSDDAAPKITRQLNQPSGFAATLIADSSQFVVPSEGGRVVLARGDGVKLFTGYLTQAPEFEYLGWGERGPVYRYALVAQSDEYILDRKMLPARAPLTARNAGAVLKQLANDLLPGSFDVTAV